MKENQIEQTPRDILVSQGWDFDIAIHDAIVEFEEKTGLCVTEIRPVRELSADGAAQPTLANIYIAVQLPHRVR